MVEDQLPVEAFNGIFSDIMKRPYPDKDSTVTTVTSNRTFPNVSWLAAPEPAVYSVSASCALSGSKGLTDELQYPAP